MDDSQTYDMYPRLKSSSQLERDDSAKTTTIRLNTTVYYSQRVGVI